MMASDTEPLVRVQGLNMVFHADVYRAWTWRDLFAKLSRDPFGVLLSEADRLHVVRDVSFDLRRGERLGIVGVNGSGKTTLCRCLTGFYRPSSGTVDLRGECRAVFDTSVGIQPELTGRENAILLSSFLFPTDPRRGRHVDESMAFSELGRFVDMPFRLYSNGMKARFCLSLISCRPWDVLVLDEVFDGADEFFRKKLSERVLRMIEGSGAVVFVSHSEEQLRRVCNRLIVMRDGAVIFDGDVAPGLKHYRDACKY